MDTGRHRRESRQAGADAAYEALNAAHAVSAQQFTAALAGELGPGMDECYGSLLHRHGLWTTALELAGHADPRVAFRASWALEWAYFHDREAIRPYLDKFLGNYFTIANRSVHRHYTKMLCDMMRKGIAAPDDALAQRIAERTFDLLVDPNTKVAVKVWCGEILFDLAPRIPWVAENLAEVVELQVERYPSPAMVNHGTKLLARIRRRG